MDRRTLIKLSSLLGVSIALPSIPGLVQAKPVTQSDAVEILTVSDGNLRLPLSFIFPDVPQAELQALLSEVIVDEKFVEPGLNLTLMRQSEHTILFDVGSGPNFMPSAGKLMESLDAASVSAEDVTDVIFTHAHPDHLWGILDDFDEVLFANATLHVPRKEFEFWTDDATLEQMPEARKAFAVGARNRFEAMSDQVQLFDPGGEVVTNVESVDTRGHTPGHTSYILHGGEEPVMVLGDALTNHVVSFQKPQWPSGSDHDPDQGIATRRTVLDRLSSEGMTLIGYHLPNAGIGQVEKTAQGFRFIPS